MDGTLREDILHLRLIIGFLGEKAQFSWWPTAFFEPSSRHFLDPVFPKTSGVAQYHGVVEAARRLHDEHLSVGSYHLFRLPEEVEQDLHALIQQRAGGGLGNRIPFDMEAASQALSKLASVPGHLGVGPTLVGRVADIGRSDIQKSIATAYNEAFEKNVRCYPYLVA
jgi:hypothetical protein